MPKISAEKRTERRGQILNAAWRCFQREGLHVTTMNEIIRASGLSAGAVYSYFENKEDLILAALTTSLSELRERLDVESSGDTWVRYWSVNPASENPPLLHWLSEQKVDVLTLSEVPRSLEEVYLRVVEQPIGQGS